MGIVYCEESWNVSWDWKPSDWSTFGYHKMRYDGVFYKALNIGPLSIYNDWTPIKTDLEIEHR